jgi:hypothetical protein
MEIFGSIQQEAPQLFLSGKFEISTGELEFDRTHHRPFPVSPSIDFMVESSIEARVAAASLICRDRGVAFHSTDVRTSPETNMKAPIITATYTAVLALLYAVLSLQVVRLRRKNRVSFGDGGNTALRSAIRAHGHFGEYVPITLLMAAFLEASGLAAMWMNALLGPLLIARLLHPFGMYAKRGTLQHSIGRVGGMVATGLVMVACALSFWSASYSGAHDDTRPS